MTQTLGAWGRSYEIIVIDDGSHIGADQRASFEFLYPRMSPTGCYLVEDLHCAYMPLFDGGGPGSGIYKSIDAGATWKRLTKGLPSGDLGRIGLDIYRRNPKILYAVIENSNAKPGTTPAANGRVDVWGGEVYRSDDAGATWSTLAADMSAWDTESAYLHFDAEALLPNTAYVFRVTSTTDLGTVGPVHATVNTAGALANVAVVDAWTHGFTLAFDKDGKLVWIQQPGPRLPMVVAEDRTADVRAQWDAAMRYWEKLHTDDGAHFDREIRLDAAKLPPIVSWGTSPEQVTSITGRVPVPSEIADENKRRAAERSLQYMGLNGGEKMTDIAINRVFIGSCTNSRIEDMREAARVVQRLGGRVASNVKLALVVPGSGLVKAQAEQEGLDRIFREHAIQDALRPRHFVEEFPELDELVGAGERGVCLGQRIDGYEPGVLRKCRQANLVQQLTNSIHLLLCPTISMQLAPTPKDRNGDGEHLIALFLGTRLKIAEPRVLIH